LRKNQRPSRRMAGRATRLRYIPYINKINSHVSFFKNIGSHSLSLRKNQRPSRRMAGRATGLRYIPRENKNTSPPPLLKNLPSQIYFFLSFLPHSKP